MASWLRGVLRLNAGMKRGVDLVTKQKLPVTRQSVSTKMWDTSVRHYGNKPFPNEMANPIESVKPSHLKEKATSIEETKPKDPSKPMDKKMCSDLVNLCLSSKLSKLSAKFQKIARKRGYHGVKGVVDALLNSCNSRGNEKKWILMYEKCQEFGLYTKAELLSFFRSFTEDREHYNEWINVVDDIEIRYTFTYNNIFYLPFTDMDSGVKEVLFKNMVDVGVCKPDEYTLVGVLSSYCSPEFCRFVHRYAMENRMLNEKVASHLIRCFGKCSEIEEAVACFHSLDPKCLTVFTYNALMIAYAEQGDEQSAIEVFDKMVQAGIRLDDVSFTGILTAHAHCGSADKAEKLFNEMVPKFGMKPNLIHYKSLINCLCGAGQFCKAEKYIGEAKIDGVWTLWRIFAFKARTHMRKDLALKALAKIPKEKWDHGVWKLNILIELDDGNYSEAEKVEQEMKKAGVGHRPGLSHLEVDNEEEWK